MPRKKQTWTIKIDERSRITFRRALALHYFELFDEASTPGCKTRAVIAMELAVPPPDAPDPVPLITKRFSLPEDTDLVSVHAYITPCDGEAGPSTGTHVFITFDIDDDPNALDSLIGRLTDLRAKQRRNFLEGGSK